MAVGHVAGERRHAPRHVEAGVLVGVDVDQHDHRHREGRRLVGERRRPVHERVAHPAPGPCAGIGPRWWRSPVTFGSSAVPTKPTPPWAAPPPTSSHTARSPSTGRSEQREAGDRRRCDARASTSPHRRWVISRTSSSRDSAVPEQRKTKSAGPSGAVPVAQLVDRRRAHDERGRRRRRRPTATDGGDGAPREEHVVVAGAPGRVAGGRHRLAEPGDEGDEQHRREQRGGVADVGLRRRRAPRSARRARRTRPGRRR